MPTTWNLFGGLVFGSIGMAALVYGKRQGRITLAVLGAALLVFPCFIANTATMWVIGVILTALLFVVRD